MPNKLRSGMNEKTFLLLRFCKISSDLYDIVFVHVKKVTNDNEVTTLHSL